MPDTIFRQLESKLHDAAHAARLSVDAVERLCPHPTDLCGLGAAIFAGDLTERLVRESLALLEGILTSERQ